MTMSALGGGALTDQPERTGFFSKFRRFLRTRSRSRLKLVRQMKVAIGGLSKENLFERMEALGSVSVCAREIFLKPEVVVSETVTEVMFGWLRIKDLGFWDNPTTPELFARISEVGALCSREDGPYLRVADRDQPRGTVYRVPIEPVVDSRDDPYIWYSERDRDGWRWLSTDHAEKGRRWAIELVVVFRLLS